MACTSRKPHKPGVIILARHDAQTLTRLLLAGLTSITSISAAGGIDLPPKGQLDLYICAGQSNMRGSGVMRTEHFAKYPRIYYFDAKRTWRDTVDDRTVGRKHAAKRVHETEVGFLQISLFLVSWM